MGFTLSTLAALLGGLLNCDAGGTPEIAPSPSKPNVVLIIIDTLRADMLGAYGFPLPTSPEFDSYSRKGVRFSRVVASNTWTRPSHGALLTSLYPRTLGLYDEKGQILADHFVTLAETFQKHGYFTAGATANPNINSHYNFHQGFDVYVDTSVVLGWMAPGPGEHVVDVDGYRLPVMDRGVRSHPRRAPQSRRTPRTTFRRTSWRSTKRARVAAAVRRQRQESIPTTERSLPKSAPVPPPRVPAGHSRRVARRGSVRRKAIEHAGGAGNPVRDHQ